MIAIGTQLVQNFILFYFHHKLINFPNKYSPMEIEIYNVFHTIQCDSHILCDTKNLYKIKKKIYNLIIVLSAIRDKLTRRNTDDNFIKINRDFGSPWTAKITENSKTRKKSFPFFCYFQNHKTRFINKCDTPTKLEISRNEKRFTACVRCRVKMITEFKICSYPRYENISDHFFEDSAAVVELVQWIHRFCNVRFFHSFLSTLWSPVVFP